MLTGRPGCRATGRSRGQPIGADPCRLIGRDLQRLTGRIAQRQAGLYAESATFELAASGRGLALDARFYRRARAPYLADKLAQAVQAGLRGELEIVGGVAAHDAEQPARLRKSIAPGCDDRAEGRARLVRMAQAERGPAALNLVTEICGPPSAGAANATTKPRPPATSPATRTSRTCPRPRRPITSITHPSARAIRPALP